MSAVAPFTPADAIALGLSIIPVRLDKKPHYDLLPKGPNGKATWKPFQTRLATPDEFAFWMQANPPGFAIATGEKSKRVTFDFDGDKGLELAQKWGISPHRRSGSGGLHWDVQHPGWYVPTLNGKAKEELGRRWPGLDVKGDGGYAIAFGRNEVGCYEWLRPPEPDNGDQVPLGVWEFLKAYREKPQPSEEARSGGGIRQSCEAGRVDPELLIRRALDQVATNGREVSGFWLAQQLRDNGYSKGEAHSWMRNYRSRTPNTNTKGEREAYTEAEMEASLSHAYDHAARGPWERRSAPRESYAGAAMRAVEAGEGGLVEPAVDKADVNDDAPEGETEARPKPPSYLGNDTGNADRLYAFYGHDLAHCEERNGYMVWNGRYWKYDRFVMSERMAEATMRRAYRDAEAISDPAKREEFVKFVSRSLSKRGLEAMVHLAKKKVRQVSTTDFDRDPFLLNCKNGTVNLRTGVLQPHRKEDLLSKMIPFDYDPAAKCPEFLRFIYRIMGDGPEATPEEKERAARLVAYLQRLFGCAATGKPEKLLVVCYGALGDNGKTTLLTTISKALGEKEYSTQVNIESLMVDPKGGGLSNAVNSDLSDLQGCRYVFSSEVERGQRLSLSRVKYLTGLTPIKTRRLRENWITFPPTWKTFMDCNDRPVISSPTDAIWNRVKCVPFMVKLSKKEINTNLGSELEAELAGILTWIVEGACEYARYGLGTAPAEVDASTDEYRESSDRLKEFIEDCCNLNQYAWVSSERLTQAYTDWCSKNGQRYPLDHNSFVEQIKLKGCTPKSKDIKAKSTRGWSGIELKP